MSGVPAGTMAEIETKEMYKYIPKIDCGLRREARRDISHFQSILDIPISVCAYIEKCQQTSDLDRRWQRTFRVTEIRNYLPRDLTDKL
jgi:hypothetical protein